MVNQAPGNPSSGERHRFHAVVRGRVQRVGYRVFAYEAARRHHCAGWVRNLPDGTVEVEAEGDELALTEFLTDLHRGPVTGHVEDIDIAWSKGPSRYHEFNIRR